MPKIDFYALAVKAAEISKQKKAISTVILDVQKLTTIASYFVITTAQSTPQINAISDNIAKSLKKENIQSLGKDGVHSSTWKVLDYGGVIVHIMSSKVRESYKIEELWSNAKNIESENLKVNDKKLLLHKTKKRISLPRKTATKATKKI